ncbi:hypothetical protein AVEN_40809-1 [Araneus ventricosus]|uniref:Uncharacterized protein n=1 Tax=Araneus ventricosus TaxID=182803 RepID=A0A4Y2CHE9_ARAVE|nr:hypothetical protein AVEN_40809-1 [Araneus ventricosus]
MEFECKRTFKVTVTLLSVNLKNENSEISFNQKEDSTVKTLVMAWKSNEDQFIFKVSVKEQTVYTKRDALSTIAKLFDTLGLLGPVICKAKIFLQRLWLEKVNWNDPLPEQFASYWSRFVCNLKELEKIKIRSLDKLTCASAKNLCGKQSLQNTILTEPQQLRHISSAENPADIISRGADPIDLKNLNLWWTGPTIFIEETNNDFYSSEIKMDSFGMKLYSAEHKQLYTNNLVLSSDSDFITQILSLSNNFQKLVRTLSFLFRFLHTCKTKEKSLGL